MQAEVVAFEELVVAVHGPVCSVLTRQFQIFTVISSVPTTWHITVLFIARENGLGSL